MENEKDINLLYFWVISQRLKFMCRVSELSVCSIFIGVVNKKNNLDQIPRVFLQVKVRIKRRLRQLEGGGGVSE